MSIKRQSTRLSSMEQGFRLLHIEVMYQIIYCVRSKHGFSSESGRTRSLEFIANVKQTCKKTNIKFVGFLLTIKLHLGVNFIIILQCNHVMNYKINRGIIRKLNVLFCNVLGKVDELHFSVCPYTNLWAGILMSGKSLTSKLHTRYHVYIYIDGIYPLSCESFVNHSYLF